MDINPNSLIYVIEGVVMLVLGGMVAYFLKETAKSLKDLSHAIVDLQIAFSKEKATTESIRNQCDRHQGLVDMRLNSHSKRIDIHDVEIAILKDREANK